VDPADLGQTGCQFLHLLLMQLPQLRAFLSVSIKLVVRSAQICRLLRRSVCILLSLVPWTKNFDMAKLLGKVGPLPCLVIVPLGFAGHRLHYSVSLASPRFKEFNTVNVLMQKLGGSCCCGRLSS
jgi:hypothetical protein